MMNYLKQSYPYYYGNIFYVVICLFIICSGSFIFNYLFEPFEVNRTEHKMDYFWICAIHAFSPLVLGLIYFTVLKFFQKDEKNWTIGKELLSLSIFLFFTGLLSFAIRDFIYDKSDNWTLRYFLEELKNTFLVGVLLLFIFVPLNLNRLINKYKIKANRFHPKKEKQLSNQTIKIKTSIASESFELSLVEFIFAKVEGNYSNIYVNRESEVERFLVRIPLKDLEDQLREHSCIFKSHRSYLINTNYIREVSGNAQGYLLTMAVGNMKVPVSRTRIVKFDSHFSS